ncbi:MAG: ROK family protein [Coprococcus sp.]
MYYGALEAGGTKMVCAIGDENKKIIDKVSIPTRLPEETSAEIIEYFKKYDICQLGIGAFGPINLDKNSEKFGTILNSTKKDWQGFNFYETFHNALGCPVKIDTDVGASAWGEYKQGALMGIDNGMYITIGTGVGAGIIVNGELLHGMLHPEAGHVILQRRADDDVPSKCRFHENCIEGLAAGPMLGRRTNMNGKDIPKEHPVWDLESYYIAQALVTYTMVLSTKRIVLGGGVMDNEFLFPMIRKKYAEIMAEYILAPELENLDEYIVPAMLKGEQGIIGALEL